MHEWRDVACERKTVAVFPVSYALWKWKSESNIQIRLMCPIPALPAYKVSAWEKYKLTEKKTLLVHY